MDPNAALRRMVETAKRIEALFDAADSLEAFQASLRAVAMDVEQAAEATLALHAWIEGGGFLPKVWAKGRA